MDFTEQTHTRAFITLLVLGVMAPSLGCDRGAKEVATEKGGGAVEATSAAQKGSGAVAEMEADCDAGKVVRCVEAGDHYLTNENAPEKARPFYKRACDIGQSAACAKLKGLDEPPEAVAAGAPAGAAGGGTALEMCEGGDGAVCNDLGLYSVRGENGFERDMAKARGFFEKACDLGESEGCNNLGFMFQSGDGVEIDEVKARDLYATSCDNGNVDGCAKLGFLLDNGQYHVRDRDRAQLVLEKACKLGSLEGCTNLGIVLIENPDARDRARENFDKACQGGYLRGCTKLGLMYYFGDGVEEDFEKARGLFSRGCDAGQHSACVPLGLLYKEGKGVEADPNRAAQFFEAACAAGHKRGCSEFEKMGF